MLDNSNSSLLSSDSLSLSPSDKKSILFHYQIQLERGLLKASEMYKIAVRHGDIQAGEGYLSAILDIIGEVQEAWRNIKIHLDER